MLYANGQGVPQDYVAAAGWYRKAAEQTHLAFAFPGLPASHDDARRVGHHHVGTPIGVVDDPAFRPLSAAPFGARETVIVATRDRGATSPS